MVTFIAGASSSALVAFIQPAGLGSHANIYAAAAAAWLIGGDPWSVGPPAAVFAGPPPMLLPYLPFVLLPIDVTRLAWFIGDLVLAAWVIRRLGLRAYWLAFPPLFAAIILGHVEVLVLGLLVLRGPLAGLAALVKPYAALPLIAERRWAALLVATVAAGVTFPFLPWSRFFDEAHSIAGTLARQNVGDSVFGDPVRMAIGALALAALGYRRALWLAVPLLWPYAQPIYKAMTLPALCPIVAVAWALPVPGATFFGIVALAALVTLDRFRLLPGWLKVGISTSATRDDRDGHGRQIPSGQEPVPA
jgi:hypothetical protein